MRPCQVEAMLILESRGPRAGSQRPPFPPASEVHVGKPAPDRQNSQVGSPQPCATRPARLQPRPLLPPFPLRGRKPPGLPSLPPTPQARSHLRAFARSAPPAGSTLPPDRHTAGRFPSPQPLPNRHVFGDLFQRSPPARLILFTACVVLIRYPIY